VLIIVVKHMLKLIKECELVIRTT